MDDNQQGRAITIADSAVSMCLAYPDGSRIELSMPKPAGIDGLTRDQAETMVRRMVARLLGVALEDLGARS
jgi:hypothetical protein